jgi:hypothetical protein
MVVEVEGRKGMVREEMVVVEGVVVIYLVVEVKVMDLWAKASKEVMEMWQGQTGLRGVEVVQVVKE